MKIFWEVCNNNNNMFDFIALLHICSWGLSESHSTLTQPAPTMYELLCSCVLYIGHESCSSTAGVCLSLCGSAPLCLSFSHQAFFTSVGLLYLSLPFRLFELKVWSLHVFLLFHCQFTKQLLFYFLKRQHQMDLACLIPNLLSVSLTKVHAAFRLNKYNYLLFLERL